MFIVGVGLICASAGLLLLREAGARDMGRCRDDGGNRRTWVLYSLLVARPRDQVREAVDHLMHLEVIFLGYLRQLHQTDQAFTRRLLEDDRLEVDEVIHDEESHLRNSLRATDWSGARSL